MWCSWWLAITVLGVYVVSSMGSHVVNEWRAQWSADAVALAVVSGEREPLGLLLDSMSARIISQSMHNETVTVVVESRWGTATASATLGQ